MIMMLGHLRAIIGFILLIAPFICNASISNNDNKLGVEVIDYGVYGFETIHKEESSHTASGTVSVVNKIVLKEKTPRIQASVGVNFGMRYRLTGLPKHGSAIIKRVTLYPDGGLTNPETGKKKFSSTIVRKLDADIHSSGFGFDSSWEIVPGIWGVQLWHQDQLLFEKKFDVYIEQSDEENNL